MSSREKLRENRGRCGNWHAAQTEWIAGDFEKKGVLATVLGSTACLSRGLLQWHLACFVIVDCTALCVNTVMRCQSLGHDVCRNQLLSGYVTRGGENVEIGNLGWQACDLPQGRLSQNG